MDALGGREIGGVVGIVVFAVVAILLGSYLFRRPAEPVETHTAVAVITESVEPTGAGTFCALMLVLHNIAVIIWFFSAQSAFQETVAATIWTGGNVLWGLGIVLGQRRTMRVYRIDGP